MTTLFHKFKTIDGIKKLKKVSESTLLILEEAEKRGILWEKIKNTTLFKLTFNGKIRYFHRQIPSETTAFAQYACKNKRITRNLLKEAGISVVNGFLVRYSDKKKFRTKLFNGLTTPLVVKPVDQMQGDNVFLNIKTEHDYIDAIQKIFSFYGQSKVDVLIEEMFFGDEYRILATQNKVISVIKRIAPNVVGDGKSSIKKLIEVKNKNPLRQKIHVYSEISLGNGVENFLKNQGLTLDSVPEKNMRVFLMRHSSLDVSNGGDTVDVTNEVHESVNEIALKIMKSIPGLSLSGIDYMTKDIYTQQTKENCRVIEVNASPSLSWNQYPLEGPKREVAYEFLKIMFPKSRKSGGKCI